jgi:cyclase
MLDVVARTAEQTFTPLTVGGGVREPGDVLALLNAGADKVAINTAAVAEPALIGRCAARFGRQAIVSAIDAKRTGDGWRIFTHGGRRDSGRDALRFAREVADLGAGEILLTSMDADGTQDGFDLELTRAVASTVPVPVIASGGAGKAAHLTAACLAGADAALAASIFHFGTVSIQDVREHFARAGLPVRFAGHPDTAIAGTA